MAFATGTLVERVRAMRVWAGANEGRPASLVLTDAILTDSARDELSGPDAPPFVDPAVAIQADGIRLSGTAVAGLRPFAQAVLRFPIRATLQPEVRDGSLSFSVRDLDTGGLPGAFTAQVRTLIGEAADPSSWRLPLRVDDVVLRSGCGVIRGVARL